MSDEKKELMQAIEKQLDHWLASRPAMDPYLEAVKDANKWGYGFLRVDRQGNLTHLTMREILATPLCEPHKNIEPKK